MKRTIAFLFVCFLVLPAVRAQEPNAAQSEAMKNARREQMKIQRGMMKVMPHLAPTFGKILTEDAEMLLMLQYGNNAEFPGYIGMSEEQLKKMEEVRQGFGTGMGMKLMPIIQRVAKAETDEDYAAIAKELGGVGLEAVEEMKKKQNDLFTPEQKTKLSELCIQSNQENAMAPMTFRAYEILDLTETQRTRLDEIKADYRKDFEALFTKMIDLQGKIMLPANEDEESNSFEKIRERQKQFDTERRAIETEGVQLKDRTKARILAMLDKTQQGKLDAIVARAPKFVQVKRPVPKEDDEEWKKSWKPGDPVPEGEQSKPKGGFPFQPL